MLDVVAIVALIAFFGLGFLYTRACDSLKGNKS